VRQTSRSVASEVGVAFISRACLAVMPESSGALSIRLGPAPHRESHAPVGWTTTRGPWQREFLGSLRTAGLLRRGKKAFGLQ
jgi:hypothetical protein